MTTAHRTPDPAAPAACPEEITVMPDPSRTVDDGDLNERLHRLSLAQKIRLLTGADFWSLYPEPAVGLRRVVVSDGPAGVRGQLWDERSPSTNVPSPTALAATWDEQQVAAIGRLLAGEARRKGVDVVLAPTVNLHRTPAGGRHFECYSEDPLLTARIGVAYVRGLQRHGVGATVKHFVANDTETERFTVDVQVTERILHELYLAPFEAVVREGGVWSVMAAYNRVCGVSMTASPLLREVLQRDWGFDGVTMSDWGANRETVATGRAALDLTMPGPDGPWGEALLAAVRAGAVPESAIDDKILRILRLAARVGALDGVPAPPPVRPLAPAQISALLRETAAAGLVLAANDGTLPVAPATVRRVAVVGPNAVAVRTLGGGSATVSPPYVVSPLTGITAAFGPDVEVVYRPGCTTGTRVPPADPALLGLPDGSGRGALVRFLGADGAELGREVREAGLYNWMGGYGAGIARTDVAEIEVDTVITATDSGVYEVGASGVGWFRIEVDGAEVFAGSLALPPGADVVEGLMAPPQRTVRVPLAAGTPARLVVRHSPGDLGGDLMGGMVLGAVFQINARPVPPPDDEAIADAVALARDVDVVVAVVGTSEEVESEGFDRADLFLPGRQDDLVAALAAANPRTVAVVNSGAPVLLPWADDVAAVLLAWFPGQEAGNALGDVLTGAAEPGGRLPTTWPREQSGLPANVPTDGVLSYVEGLHIGYRCYDRTGHAARYPFGHGLGYTSWTLRDVQVPARVAAGQPVPVTVELTNTGTRRGRQVVQVYARREGAGVERPRRWLAGFATTTLDPGQSRRVEIAVAARTLEYWDEVRHGWRAEPGTFRLQVGTSIAHLPLDAGVTVLADR